MMKLLKSLAAKLHFFGKQKEILCFTFMLCIMLMQTKKQILKQENPMTPRADGIMGFSCLFYVSGANVQINIKILTKRQKYIL